MVVADVEGEGEYQFERRWYGSNPEQLRALSEWLFEQQVEEAVMESTAQYWKPVWGALERYWKPTCRQREGVGPERYIWRRRCRIAGGGGARTTFVTLNAWGSDGWHRS